MSYIYRCDGCRAEQAVSKGKWTTVLLSRPGQMLVDSMRHDGKYELCLECVKHLRDALSANERDRDDG